MNTFLRWDPISGTRWNPFKDRDELESRLATMLATREVTGNGGKMRMGAGCLPTSKTGCSTYIS